MPTARVTNALRERVRRHRGEPDAVRTDLFAGFGSGSHIAAPARVSSPHRIHIGSGVIIHPGAWLSVVEEHAGRAFTPALRIGDGSVLGHALVVACVGEVEIGAEVLASDRVFIGDTSHDYRDPEVAVLRQPMTDPRPVRIGAGSFLGIGSMVLPGVTIGERAYVAAGAVVTRSAPANSVVAGNPARVIRRWDPAQRAWTAPPHDHG